MAVSPTGVAGTLMKTLGRFSAAHNRRASSIVPLVSCARWGLTQRSQPFQRVAAHDSASLLSSLATLARQPVTLGATESCLEKYSNQLPSERIRDHAAAQADHVHVVVLDPLAR